MRNFHPKIVFLDAGTFYGSPSIAEMLLPLGQVALYEYTSPKEVVERIAEAHIVLTNKVVLDENIFSRCPELKLICVTATGTNNIDLDAAKRRNIQVKNAAGYSTHSVAQTTLAMVLHLVMRLHARRSFVETSYPQHPFFTHLQPGFQEINGKTWGIIGLGAIGSQVAKIANALGAKVVYHSPSGRQKTNEYSHLTLLELLSSSDIISIHSPLNEFTKNLIGQKELAICKPTALLINVARGGIVEELALAKALDNDELGGAGVDVYSVEPIQPDNPLLHLKNKEKLLLTPHIAWGSYEARHKLMEITCGNIEEFLKEQKIC
jgi:lactate dehydrogenase-like 2-hydroxyacid dehydrogenase